MSIPEAHRRALSIGRENLFVEEFRSPGTGSETPLVVWVHGYDSAGRGSKSMALAPLIVAAGARFICFDFRGHGQSGGGMAGLSLSRNIEDLTAVIEACAPGAAVDLVGSSMGGLTAAWFAALHPEKVRRAALIAPAFDYLPLLLTRFGLAASRRMREAQTLLLPRGFDDSTQQIGLQLVEDLAWYPRRLLEAEYQTPSLIIHGEQDERIPLAGSLEFQSACRAPVDLHLIAGGDHRLAEQREQVAQLVVSFLGLDQ